MSGGKLNCYFKDREEEERKLLEAFVLLTGLMNLML